jgi:hypothetical protein
VCSSSFQLQRCWATDPKERISAADLSLELLKLPHKAFLATVPQVAAAGPDSPQAPAPAPASAPHAQPPPPPHPTTSASTKTQLPSAPNPAAEPQSRPSAPAAHRPPSQPRPVMSPVQDLAEFKKVFTPESSAIVAYRDDVDCAAQLCSDFAAEEAKHHRSELSVPLHEAAVLLKKVLVCTEFANDWKARISSSLPEAVAVVKNVSFRDELDHQRLKEWDEGVAALSKLTFQAEQLLARQPAWPRHEALIHFDLPLFVQKQHLLFKKEWTSRFVVLRGSRLYYSNGKSGHPDSLEGSLAFMQCNPKPDGRYCVDLKGACACCVKCDQRIAK